VPRYTKINRNANKTVVVVVVETEEQVKRKPIGKQTSVRTDHSAQNSSDSFHFCPSDKSYDSVAVY